MSVHVKKMILF